MDPDGLKQARFTVYYKTALSNPATWLAHSRGIITIYHGQYTTGRAASHCSSVHEKTEPRKHSQAPPHLPSARPPPLPQSHASDIISLWPCCRRRQCVLCTCAWMCRWKHLMLTSTLSIYLWTSGLSSAYRTYYLQKRSHLPNVQTLCRAIYGVMLAHDLASC